MANTKSTPTKTATKAASAKESAPKKETTKEADGTVVTPKHKDVDAGKTQGSETKKLAVEPEIEDEHPATENKHVVVPDTKDNEITPPESLKTDVQNESTRPHVATNIPAFDHTVAEVKEEIGEKKDTNYGGVAEPDADEKNREAFEKAIAAPYTPTPLDVEKMEEDATNRITEYLKKQNGGNVPLNDFLKSFYPVKPGEPAAFQQQGNSKFVRHILGKMVADGSLKLIDTRYDMLGKPYYKGEEQIQYHWDLTNVPIVAVK